MISLDLAFRRKIKMEFLGDKISRELLPRVEQPSQYIGLEHNARYKDPENAQVRFVLAFPDAYTIGISHLGSQILYYQLNDIDYVSCDRSYTPLPDAEQVMRDYEIPMFTWESRTALRDHDIIGFSVGYELCVTNVLTMLDLAGIPLIAADRSEDDPIITAGNSMADSPEAISKFIDVFTPGDGENTLRDLAELMRVMKTQNLTREQKLLRIAKEVPSAYVPRFYKEVCPPGKACYIEPDHPEVPATIARAAIQEMSESPTETNPIVPLCQGVHERVMTEVMRGCPNLCRFCQAGHARLPVRLRDVNDILHVCREAIANTGYNEISLLSLSTSDYPELPGLIEKLNDEFADKHVSISLPSLKVDSQLTILPKLTSTVRKGGLTIAAEAGSEKMRKAMRKNLTEFDMIEGVSAAWEAGYKSVKVYFMAGLPGETFEDLEQIVYLCKRLSWTRKKFDGHRGAITASVSWLVPKPHTPLQWAGMQKEDYFWSVRERLIELAKKSPVNVKFHRIEQSILESFIGRGSRAVADIILEAWKQGARLDSWNEHWNWELWEKVIKESDIDFDAIVHTDYNPEDKLPWSHITCHLGEEFLKKQWQTYYNVLENWDDQTNQLKED